MILAHKQAFLRLLTVTSREAQAQDPETLGRQLAVHFESATALVTSIDDIAPFDTSTESWSDHWPRGSSSTAAGTWKGTALDRDGLQ